MVKTTSRHAGKNVMPPPIKEKEMKDDDKYYLRADFMDEYKEVSKEEFIRAEQAAGFYSKFRQDHPATAGFSGGGVSGMVKRA